MCLSQGKVMAPAGMFLSTSAIGNCGKTGSKDLSPQEWRQWWRRWRRGWQEPGRTLVELERWNKSFLATALQHQNRGPSLYYGPDKQKIPREINVWMLRSSCIWKWKQEWVDLFELPKVKQTWPSSHSALFAKYSKFWEVPFNCSWWVIILHCC